MAITREEYKRALWQGAPSDPGLFDVSDEDRLSVLVELGLAVAEEVAEELVDEVKDFVDELRDDVADAIDEVEDFVRPGDDE
jgi:ABC-type Fe3+-hydroxamate transport system substrate-binding protein